MTAQLRDAFFLVLCLVNLVGAAALLLAPDWSATWLPWPLDPMSRVFLGAILAATGGAILWIVASGEYAAAAAGALDLIIAYCGIALYLFVLREAPVSGALAILGWLCLISAATVAAIFGWASMLSFRRPAPLRAWLRILFAAFGALFLLAGIGLALLWPNALPWRVDPDVAPILAAAVFGAAAYLLHPVVKPIAQNARCQLISLAIFAAVMAPALAGLLPVLDPSAMTSFLVFAAVLVVGLAAAVRELLFGASGKAIAQPPGVQKI